MGECADTDTSTEGTQTSFQWDNYGFEGTKADPDDTLSPTESHRTGNTAPPSSPTNSRSLIELMAGMGFHCMMMAIPIVEGCLNCSRPNLINWGLF